MANPWPEDESQAWREIQNAWRTHDHGLILPVVSVIVAILMLPVTLLVGGRHKTGTAEEVLAFHRHRAIKMDLVNLGFLAAAIVGWRLDLAASQPALLWLGGYRVLNILASSLYYTVLELGHGVSGNLVLSHARSILLGFLNYLELVFWFAMAYLTSGTIVDDGKTVTTPELGFHFSAITQLTIGYGTISPVGAGIYISAVQAMTGVTVITLLIGRLLGSMKPVDQLT